MKRNSQSGTNAAILVAIIATLIIIYIIFLPESEKANLLENRTSGSRSSESGSGVDIILREFPGTISGVSGVEDEKSLPNVFLVESKDAKELVDINPFIVSRSIFGQKSKTEQFSLPDFENVDNVMLTFNAKTRSGVLTITLNSNIIYESEITEESVEPVRINSNMLKRDNSLMFSVSSPGAKFWHTNSYSIDNVKIIGDITDKSRQESQNIFLLSEHEVKNVKEAKLKFIPYCGSVQTVGTLDVIINNRKIFSSVPICDDPYTQIIPTGVLRKGDNVVVFKTSKGSYSIEESKVMLEFNEPKTKTYYFEINRTDYISINNTKTKDAVLIITFPDDDTDKEFKLDLNGHFKNVDIRKSLYTLKMNDDISQGNNYLRITPVKKDIEVVEIKVELIKR